MHITAELKSVAISFYCSTLYLSLFSNPWIFRVTILVALYPLPFLFSQYTLFFPFSLLLCTLFTFSPLFICCTVPGGSPGAPLPCPELPEFLGLSDLPDPPALPMVLSLAVGLSVGIQVV